MNLFVLLEHLELHLVIKQRGKVDSFRKMLIISASIIVKWLTTWESTLHNNVKMPKLTNFKMCKLETWIIFDLKFIKHFFQMTWLKKIVLTAI